MGWANRKDHNAYHLSRCYRLRGEALAALGGICARCGFSDRRALQIDHKSGGGSKDIKARGWNRRYQEIIKDPGAALLKLQVLCANCNWIKRDENHETR